MQAVEQNISQLMPYFGCTTVSVRTAVVHVLAAVMASVIGEQVRYGLQYSPQYSQQYRQYMPWYGLHLCAVFCARVHMYQAEVHAIIC